MPRTARLAPGDTLFHVLNRGVGRMRLFLKPGDFEAFERVIAKTLLSRPMRIVSYCLLSNHWHMVLWPENEGDLAGFMQKLTITHVRNWQENRRRVGYGHLYQGRYKSFPIEGDEHFFHVTRYVERNALRANLVRRAQDWRWSSLWIRRQGTPQQRELLASWPLPEPADWLKLVNEPQTEEELEAIRRSLVRGQPYGSSRWIQRTAKSLGLESTLRKRGRPSKAENSS
jgi:putative transposase